MVTLKMIFFGHSMYRMFLLAVIFLIPVKSFSEDTIGRLPPSSGSSGLNPAQNGADIPDKETFRTNIGAVSKSGDSMTGALTLPSMIGPSTGDGLPLKGWDGTTQGIVGNTQGADEKWDFIGGIGGAGATFFTYGTSPDVNGVFAAKGQGGFIFGNGDGPMLRLGDTGSAEIIGNATIDGTFTTIGDSLLAHTVQIGQGSGSGTTTTTLNVGQGVGNHSALINLVGDSTNNTYGLRIVRDNQGANATSRITHVGTGQFTIQTENAAALVFGTGATARITIGTTGNIQTATSSNLGFFGATPAAKPAPTGACAGNTGCQALRDALGTLGLINPAGITN